MKPIEILIRAKDEASSVFDVLKRNAATVGAAIAGYFGFNAFVGAVKGAADLEAALSQVKAVSGASADEMVKLRAAAEAAGRDTQYSATEAATALGNLARSGMTATQAIEAMPATLRLAAAGGIALEQSSTIVTRTLAGFVLQAGEAARVADVLALGANASNTSVQGLGEALSYAAPIAKSVGLSLEGTVAIIGKFADAGIDASRAGTALNAILGQFADPASKFRAELSNMGITTGNFEKALGQLAAAGSKGEKAILAVGTEAGPALRGLLNQGIGALNELKAKLSDAGGSAEATAKVMQDNLNGSIKGLGSAWDTLKNALATPVLPVLKNGIDSLAASFKNAVESGLIGKFGDAIAKGFESSIEWAKRFAAEVDFEAFAARMEGYAASAGEAFDTIKTYATNAGNIVQTVWGVMSAGSNAVLTVVYGVGSAFATVMQGIQSGLALLMNGLAKVTFGGVSASFKAAADEMRLSAAATGAASEELAKKANAALVGMAEGAQMARNGWDGISGSADESAKHIATAKRVIDDTATSLRAMGGDAQAAGQKAAQASVVQREAAEKALAKVAELRAEYAKALQSGDSSKQIEALRGLEHAVNAATVAVRALNKENDAAKESANAVAAAFQGMGIKTKAELQTLADTAKTRFDLIKASGQATAEGLASAWKQMTEAAIAANGGVATGTQKAEAAMYKLKIEVDATGKAIVVAMNDGSSATNGFTGAVNNAKTALERLNDERERGIAAHEKSNELDERAAQLERDRLNVDKQGYTKDRDGNRMQASVNTPMERAFRDGYVKRDSNGLYDPEEMKRALILLDERDKVNEERLRAGVRGSTGSSGGMGSGAASTPTVPAKTYNVQLGNKTVKTNSDTDAQNLIAALRQAGLSA